MPRRTVEFRAGESYHVFNRGNNRQKIFFSRENYAHFLRLMRRHIRRELQPVASEDDTPGVSETPGVSAPADAAEILAYCLMPNHFHFLVYLHRDEFAAEMQAFQMAYTKAIDKGMQRTGALFTGRFHAVHVDCEEYILHLSRYLHLNPVAADLCVQPEDWEFSSFRDYVGLRSGTLPKPDRILRSFDSADHYRRFVESGIGCHDPRIEHLVLE